jgi:hypothetical protein
MTIREGAIPMYMLDIDAQRIWELGRGIFASWFVPSGLVAKYVLLRGTQRFPSTRYLAADAAMNLASSLVVIVVPLAIVVDGMVHALILDRITDGNAIPFSVPALLALSAAFGSIAELIVLRWFFAVRPRWNLGIWLFLVNCLCTALAAWRMAVFLAQHPPLA